MKNIIIVIILALVGFSLFKLFTKPPTTIDESAADLVLFWGQGCPHCENVDKYIQEHQLDKKIIIVKKEVWYNKTNQNQMLSTLKNCPSIDTSKGIGVPMAFDPKSKQCFEGDQPIIDWLSSK